MNDQDIISLWKAQDAKLEQALTLNRQVLKEVVSQKAKHSLDGLIRFKTRGIISVCIYLLVLGTLLRYAFIHYSSAANYFIISVTIIFLINVRALYDYVKHLIWIRQINYNGSIVAIQEKLSRLQFSIVQHSRIMTLQFPFFTTLFLSNTWFPQSIGAGYLIFQLFLTGSFTFLSYWLFKNQNIHNLDKKWYRKLLAGSGGKKVEDAIAFYREIEAYKMENSQES